MGFDAKRERWIRVCRAGDIKPGSCKIISVRGREVGVFFIAGRYHAILNRCPHKGAPLCLGRLRPLISAASEGTLHYEREGEILQCPWHMWEFDIRSGRSIADGNLRVKTYQMQLREDGVFLRVSS